VIRRIDSGGNVTTYAGVAGQNARVDGPIATARFQLLLDAALGPDGAVYVVDTTDNPAASSARSHRWVQRVHGRTKRPSEDITDRLGRHDLLL